MEFTEKFLSATYGHIWSFNLFLEFYLERIVSNLDAIYIGENLRIRVTKIEIGRPLRIDSEKDIRMFPRHARTSHGTYGAPMYTTFSYNYTGFPIRTKRVYSGLCPIMVRSNNCHLVELSPFEMCRYAGEDLDEPGGYFIINGNEKCLRFVIQQRSNYPIAIRKARLAVREPLFTEYAISFRGQSDDGSATVNILFFTEDNQCVFRILLNRAEWTCPFNAVLAALYPTVQQELVMGRIFDNNNDLELEAEFESLLESLKDPFHLDIDNCQDRYLANLGKFFIEGLINQGRLRPSGTQADAGRLILKNFILTHTADFGGKFETLIHMWKKLWSMKRGLIPPENIDSFALQECLGPGQLFAMLTKDGLYNTLSNIRTSYLYEIRLASLASSGGEDIDYTSSTSGALLSDSVDILNILRSESLFDKIIDRYANITAKSLSYFVSTGNIRTMQLDVQQTTGWAITADRLNMNRFISHFRAVHRGAFFAKMRTTEVRKLVGETWGFICPVHTPDGPCCGLLLHLAQDALIISDPPDGKFKVAVKNLVRTYGISCNGDRICGASSSSGLFFPIIVDGEPICSISLEDFEIWKHRLRVNINNGIHGFRPQVEMCLFPNKDAGIFLFSYPCRLVRPVRNARNNQVEWIGPLAQPWVSIAPTMNDLVQCHLLNRIQSSKIIDGQRGISSFHDVVKSFSKCLRNPQDEMNYATRLGLESSIVTQEILDSVVASYENEELREEVEKILGELVVRKSGTLVLEKIFEVSPVVYDYVEVTPTSFLSVNASFTPLSNHNQSPRNMYQCQMLKQTMGTPYHNLGFRCDNKVYKILFPGRPLVCNLDYRRYNMTPYGSGTNAVVAVISYTGFDMEDAMIINKNSMERGFCHGCVYKTKVVDAAPDGTRLADSRNFVFSNRNPDSGLLVSEGLEIDGLPRIGSLLSKYTPMYRTYDIRDPNSGHLHRYTDDEEAFVDKIFLINPNDNKISKFTNVYSQRIIMTLRCIRNPIIGDKFASRAGQKGILSLLYPSEDMPFTTNGITPDILFNPHGFPSRMTIGMIVESMAGKAAAHHAQYQDSTPFRTFPKPDNIQNKWIDQGGYNGFTRRGNQYMTSAQLKNYKYDNPVDYFGKTLLNAGYQYYGTEPLHSGIYGVEMETHIFTGIIYYQRLRHMVSDKWQCRSIGPIDALTHQPVKGRKRGGGVRLGEMERDALLGHGASFILQDRLVNVSQICLVSICQDSVPMVTRLMFAQNVARSCHLVLI